MSQDTNTKTRDIHFLTLYHTENVAEGYEHSRYRYECIIDSRIYGPMRFINTAMQKCIADVRKE